MTATAILENILINKIQTFDTDNHVEVQATWSGFPVTIIAYGKAAESLAQAEGQQVTVNGDVKPMSNKGLVKGLIFKANRITLATNNDNNIVEVIQQILSEVNGNPKTINKDRFVSVVREIEKVLA
jgi:hypothetical protein